MEMCKYAGYNGCVQENCPGTARCKTYYAAATNAFRERAKAKDINKWRDATRKGSKEQWRKMSPGLKWATLSIAHHKMKGYKMDPIVNVRYAEKLLQATNYICPVCGCHMEHGKDNVWNSPTLDDMNATREITPGNIWIICHRCNCMKMDRSVAQWLVDMKSQRDSIKEV
jgi:hypothetical protein